MPSNLNPPSQLYPDDGRIVGSDAIFSSPNVTPPPDAKPQDDGRIDDDDGIPAPSVYRDERGEIHNVKVNDRHRINVLYTKGGCLRSGDLHPNTQCDFVFSGRVRVWTLEEDGSTKVTAYGAHEYVEVPRGVPHVFEFVEDTVMAEWWEPQGFQAWFYRPYRDIVNRSMLEDDGEDGGRRKRQRKGLVILSPSNDWGTAKMVLSAAVFGMFGFALGKSRFGNR